MKRGVRDECFNRKLAHSPLATLKKREGNWVQLTFTKTSGIVTRDRKKKYRKIPKISSGADIFQRPFLRDLFLKGLIFGGAYLWREICVSKSIGLAL